MNARQLAIETLLLIEKRQAYSNIALSKALSVNGQERGPDVALATELVYGTLRWQGALDYVIDSVSRHPVDKLSPAIRIILRTGAYQLYFLTRIPRYAAVNEAVNAARKYGHRGTVALVNAVLRRLPPDMDGVAWPSRERDPITFIAARYSHPAWLVRRWADRHGIDKALAICMANNDDPPLTVRTNILKTEPSALASMLTERGYAFSPGELFEEALLLRDAGGIWSSSEYLQGLFQPQDEASMCAAYALDPYPGGRVLDLCSAPGGKSTHLAEMMGNKGCIIAADINAGRLQLLGSNAQRLGIGIIRMMRLDARSFTDEMPEMFDRVMVDAPCSGTGAIRRKPEIKWRLCSDKISDLTSLQSAILNEAAKAVLPGGRMVYSTCSIEPEEDEDVVKAFLSENRDFRALNVRAKLPERIAGGESPWLYLLPGDYGTDGFFMCLMERSQDAG